MTTFNLENTCFIGAASFEERSIVGPKHFLDNGGRQNATQLVILAEESSQLEKNIKSLAAIGINDIPKIDRFSSRSLWEWAWEAVRNSAREVVIDSTGLPRELLGIVLFALSVRRESLDRVRVYYVSALHHSPQEGYATQNETLPEEDRWLSRGVTTIRSIVGYPGDFMSERRRHVVALAGHEQERMYSIITYLEPNKLSINNEQEETSTVEGADAISKDVAEELRNKIALPEIQPVRFSANSIEETFSSLQTMLDGIEDENVSLVAMNTKLSFIGASLYALHNRKIRMVYAVPEEYNPLYSTGAGELKEFDITEHIKTANTIPVRLTQGE